MIFDYYVINTLFFNRIDVKNENSLKIIDKF